LEFSFSLKDPDLYRKIFLHTLDTSIHEPSISILGDGGVHFEIVGFEYDLERQVYIIHLENELPRNKSFSLEMR